MYQYSNRHDFSLWIFGIFGHLNILLFNADAEKRSVLFLFLFFLQRDFVRKENVEKTKLDWSTEREFRRQQLLSQTLVFYGSTQLTYLLFQKLKLEKVLINVPPQSFKQAETWLRLLCGQVNDSDSLYKDSQGSNLFLKKLLKTYWDHSKIFFKQSGQNQFKVFEF